MEEALTPSDADPIEPDVAQDDAPADPDKPTRDATKGLLALVVVLLVGVLVLQFIQLQRTADTNAEVAALAEDVTDLKPLRRDVDILGDQLAALDGQVTAAVNAAGVSPAAIPTQTCERMNWIGGTIFGLGWALTGACPHSRTAPMTRLCSAG